jgi:glyoxylase-like metal-dependent hydrolase (beta-lactamase superfamily II)
MTSLPEYEIFALRYGHMVRKPGDMFISGDAHESPGEMDYFVWLIRGSGGVNILVDTGFNAVSGAKRKRTLLRPVDQCLSDMGVSCDDISDVVITHMHYDHAGNIPLFPKARLHIQDREMSFATGRFMCHAMMNHPFDVDDVCCMVHRVFGGNVKFHDGHTTLRPGITLHHVGGHADGLMALRVWTQRGWVVLAADVTHYYTNLIKRDPFPAIFNLGQMFEGYDRLLEMSGGTLQRVVPGHDPLVMKIYPRIKDLDIVALHEEPRLMPWLTEIPGAMPHA